MPAGGAASATTPRPARAPAEGATAQPTQRRRTVLVVEDHASVGGILVGLLRESGYRTLRAWDSREALKMARDRLPDVIVFDLGLPYHEGFKAIGEMRASPDLATTPIVITSVNPILLPPDEQANVVIVNKPVDIDRLLNHVRRALGEPEVTVEKPAYTFTDEHAYGW
jgi:DNA-binding response OmpR family regulator